MRMVAEHVEDPPSLAETLARCLVPGGRVIVYTVNRFSPVPLLTRIVPFRLHHPMKRILWGSQKKDTVPTFFRVNTRERLRQVFGAVGFSEVYFS
jgi:Methyltransferase domain